MKNYLKTWNFMRSLRLAIGIYIIIQSVLQKEWWFTAIGVFISISALSGSGCCGASGCTITNTKTIKKLKG